MPIVGFTKKIKSCLNGIEALGFSKINPMNLQFFKICTFSDENDISVLI